MEIAALKQEIDSLKGDIVALTGVMKERNSAGQTAEVKELADKLSAVQKELADRKHQFSVGTEKATAAPAADVDRKRDELFIAKALLRTKDGALMEDQYKSLLQSVDYRDAVKASAFTFDGTVPDGMVSGGDGTAANYGSDFVVEGFSRTLLEEINLALEVAGLFGRINMPAPTYNLPFAFDRVTARLGKEAVAPTKDKFGTGLIQFTAKKVLANIDFTDELEADSVIAILPLVRQKLIEGFALAQEQIVLNGDTTAAENHIDGNIGADDVRRAVKGLRRLAIDGTDTVDFSGTFDAAALRSLRAKMGKYGKNPSDLAYIMTMNDYMTILGFDSYQTLDKFGDKAVVFNGVLGALDGIPVIVSELLPENLNATGVYDGVTTTKSSCMLVNKQGFLFGDRKQFSLETFRNPYTQIQSLIGSQRLDFQKVLSATSVPVALGINY